MPRVTNSFTGVGAGPNFHLKVGQRATYDVSGTFVGTVVLERSTELSTWETVATASAAASGAIANERAADEHYRFRCTAFTSGTIVTKLVPDDVAGRKLMVPATGLAKVGGTAGWAVAPADNLSLVTLPASQTGSKLVIPVAGLRVGDKILGFHLLGQIESAGGAVTLDAELRKHTAAAADVADAQVGAMTQIAASADTKVDAENSERVDLSEIVGADETFYLVLTGTTAAATDIAIQGAAILLEPAR